jgi:hypothetical protein
VVIALALLLFGTAVGMAFGLLMMLQSFSFAMGLRMVGRSRGVLRFAMRASGYTHGVLLVAMSVLYSVKLWSLFGDHIAWADVLVSATIVGAIALFCGRVYFWAARGLGVRSGPALLAATGPTVVSAAPAAYLLHLSLPV